MKTFKSFCWMMKKRYNQHVWFDMTKIRDFVLATEQWIKHVKDESAAKNYDIEPGDSISEGDLAVRKKKEQSRFVSSLKKKQALQVEEINLKAKLKQLELQTAIAVSKFMMNMKILVNQFKNMFNQSTHWMKGGQDLRKILTMKVLMFKLQPEENKSLLLNKLDFIMPVNIFQNPKAQKTIYFK